MNSITFKVIAFLLFVTGKSIAQNARFDRVEHVTVNQLPRYNSLANATAAGSRPGNLVYVYTGAEKGVYVRYIGNNGWEKIGGDLDSIKIYGSILYSYNNGDSAIIGSVGGNGGITNISMSSDKNGIVTIINGQISNNPHKISLAALSDNNAEKHNTIKFDGEKYTSVKENSLQAGFSSNTIITDSTISKIDNNYIWSFSDRNLWKVSASKPNVSDWFIDSLNVFSKKTYAPGLVNNYTTYNNFQRGVSFNPTSGRSWGYWWQRGHIDKDGAGTATRFIAVEYPTQAITGFLKIFSQTSINSIQNLANTTDTVVFSFWAKGVNRSMDIEGNFYAFSNSANQLGSGTSLRFTAKIDTGWNKIEIKYLPNSVTVFSDNSGTWSETSTTNNTSFLVALTKFEFMDTFLISHVRYDQIKKTHNIEQDIYTLDTLRSVTIANNGYIVVNQIDEVELETLALPPSSNTSFHNNMDYPFALSANRNKNVGYGYVLYKNATLSPLGERDATIFHKVMTPQSVNINNFSGTGTNTDFVTANFGTSQSAPAQTLVGQISYKVEDIGKSFVADLGTQSPNGGNSVNTPRLFGHSIQSDLAVESGMFRTFSFSNQWKTRTITKGSLNLTGPVFQLMLGPSIPPDSRISFYGLQVNEGNVIKPVRQTEATFAIKDTAYISFIDDRGVLNLGKISQPIPNDRAWIQYALYYCRATDGCKTVFLPARTYSFYDTTLVIPDRVNLMGSGWNATTIDFKYRSTMEGITMRGQKLDGDIIYLPYQFYNGTNPAIGDTIRQGNSWAVISGILNINFNSFSGSENRERGFFTLGEIGARQGVNRLNPFPYEKWPSVFKRQEIITLHRAGIQIGSAVARNWEDFKVSQVYYTDVSDLRLKATGATMLNMLNTGINSYKLSKISRIEANGNFKSKKGVVIATPYSEHDGVVSLRLEVSDIQVRDMIDKGIHAAVFNTSSFIRVSSGGNYKTKVGLEFGALANVHTATAEYNDTGLLIRPSFPEFSTYNDPLSPIGSNPSSMVIQHYTTEGNNVDVNVEYRNVTFLGGRFTNNFMVSKSSVLNLIGTMIARDPIIKDSSSVINNIGVLTRSRTGATQSMSSNEFNVFNLGVPEQKYNSIKNIKNNEWYNRGITLDSAFVRDGSTIGGLINLSNLRLNGKTQNLLLFSDSLNTTSSLNSLGHNVLRKSIRYPGGLGDYLFNTVPNSEKGSSSRFSNRTIQNFVLGRPYTVSFFAKALPGLPTTIRIGGSILTSPLKGFTVVDTNWRRYEMTWIPDSANFSFVIAGRYTGVYFGGAQVNEGTSALPFVATNGSYINNSDIFIRTKENRPVNFDSLNINLTPGSEISWGSGNKVRENNGKLEYLSNGTWTPLNGLQPMTTAQRDNLISPFAGQMVFDTTVGRVSVFDGSSWRYLSYL
jgi:hypothetical protein